jgi:hypothetical protein
MVCCVEKLFDYLGLPYLFGRHTARRVFPDFGSALTVLTFLQKDLSIRLVGSDGDVVVGTDPKPVSVYCYYDNWLRTNHVDIRSEMPMAHRWRLENVFEIHMMLMTWEVYSNVNAPNTSSNAGRNQNVSAPNNTNRRGGRGRGGPKTGPKILPKIRPKNSPFPANNQVQNQQPITPKVRPKYPPRDAGQQLETWVGLIRSVAYPAGSEDAKKLMEQAGFKVSGIIETHHPLSRAQRFLMWAKIAPFWYWHAYNGRPMRWVAPSNGIKALFAHFEKCVDRAPIPMLSLIMLNGSRAGLGCSDPNLRRSAWNIRFDKSLKHKWWKESNLIAAIDRLGLQEVDSWADGSMLAFRNFFYEPSCLNNGEIEITPVSGRPDVVNVGLPHHSPSVISQVFRSNLSDEVVRVRVKGQSVFHDWAHLASHVTDLLALRDKTLDVRYPAKDYGDYSFYEVTSGVKLAHSLSLPPPPPPWTRSGGPFTPFQQYLSDFCQSHVSCIRQEFLEGQVVEREVVDLDPWLWWLFGENAPFYFPRCVKRMTIPVFNVPDPSLVAGQGGSSFLSTAILETIQSSPIVKFHSDKPLVDRLSVNTVRYLSWKNTCRQREIVEGSRRSGVAFGSYDENRNFFNFGFAWRCCGVRKSNNIVE